MIQKLQVNIIYIQIWHLYLKSIRKVEVKLSQNTTLYISHFI